MTLQNVEFQNRIARIMAGEGTTKATVFVGQEFTFAYVPKNRRKSGMSGTLGNAGFAMAFPASFVVGFASHVLERYADWIVDGVPKAPENYDVEMLKVAVTGGIIAILLTHILGFRERGLLIPKFLGVIAGMLFFHNLVHINPELFNSLFSPIWVAKITSMTEPASMYFRGVSFTF